MKTHFWIAGLLLVGVTGAWAAESQATFEGRPIRSEQLIGKLKNSGKQSTVNGGRMAAGRPMRSFRRLPGIVVVEAAADPAGKKTNAPSKADRTVALKAEMRRLMATGQFEFVEPDYEVRALATPSDAAFVDGRLWGLRNTGQSGGTAGADIETVAGWDVTTGSPGVIVAVIDSGIRTTHQDLAANLWVNPGEIPGNGIDDDANGYVDDVHGINAITGSGDPTDDNNHGTHVAGTIGAVANGGGPHVGVAWSVRLMGLKFLDSAGRGSTSDAIECIDYAIANGATILNNSWGGGGFSNALQNAIIAARNANVLFVAAAGNDANNNDSNPSYPASYAMDNVVSVAAITRSDQLSSFSNFGATSVDLAAPGAAIFSTVRTSDSAYATFNGTSMAAPHVSGVAALVRAAVPGISVADLRQRLLGSVRPVAALSGRVATAGSVSAARALALSADGNLEVSVSSVPAPLRSGQTATLSVTVADGPLVTGATVSGSLAGGNALTFRDNGVSPDAVSGDGTYSALAVVPAATGAINLSVQVSAPGKNGFSGAFPLAVAAVPSNDDFSAAPSIPGATTVVQATNENASSQSGEPAHAGESGGRSVWWTWTPATAGSATITTSGSSFDTLLAVYSGNTLAALTPVASNDDFSGTLQSSVTFVAQAGVVYRIAVDGYAGAVGAITLNVPPAAGDAAAVPFYSRQPAGVTVSGGETATFSVVVTSATPVEFRWRRDGVPLDDGGRISGVTTSALTIAETTKADEGTYDCVARNTFGPATSAAAYLAVNEAVVVPPNDTFFDSLALTGDTALGDGSNVNATVEPGEPNHAGVSGGKSVWWTWTPSVSGEAVVDTLGSTYDTALAIYTGGSVGALTQVAANDDSDGGRQSKVAFFAFAGVPYRIAVDGYGSEAGNIQIAARALTSGSAPPRLAVVSPAGREVALQQSRRVVIRGFASDDTALARVEYRLRGRPWKSAVGRETWRAVILLPKAPRRWVVRIRAVDIGNNVSPARKIIFDRRAVR